MLWGLQMMICMIVKKTVTLRVDFDIKYFSTCTTMVSTKEAFLLWATTWNWFLFFFFVDFSSTPAASLVPTLNQCVSVFLYMYCTDLLFVFCLVFSGYIEPVSKDTKDTKIDLILSETYSFWKTTMEIINSTLSKANKRRMLRILRLA